jgi:hypothetical protein
MKRITAGAAGPGVGRTTIHATAAINRALDAAATICSHLVGRVAAGCNRL